MPFQLLSAKDLISCAAIAAMMYAMASARSSRVRGVIVSLPIPLTLVLWSKPEMVISAGHVLGIALLMIFFWGNWLLYARARLPIVASMAITTLAYVLLGHFTLKANWLPYWFALGYTAAWAVYAWRLYDPRHEAVPPSGIPAWAKAAGTFAACSFFFSLAQALGPALATAPLLSYFTVIECRKFLGTICHEFTRNAIAIMAYLVTYAATPAPFLLRIAVSWSAFFAAFFLARALTPKRPEHGQAGSSASERMAGA